MGDPKLPKWSDLSDEEQAALLTKTTISNDDETALCTKAGWARYQAEKQRAKAPSKKRKKKP